MTVISLTTDFGYGDFKPGILSGLLLSRAPEVKIADLTHNLETEDILGMAVILSRHIHYFPPGSIHINIMGSDCCVQSRLLAAQIGSQYFVGPDNGALTLIIQDAQKRQIPTKYIQINGNATHEPLIFSTLDLLASTAGYLAHGAKLECLGNEINDPVLIKIPAPIQIKNGWKGSILRVDHFGNMESNIHHSIVGNINLAKVKCGSYSICRFVQTFGNSEPGELVAMIDSSGVVSICVVNGSAAERLQSGVGTTIEVNFE
jgi:S-adenosylmethionine hydrolase